MDNTKKYNTNSIIHVERSRFCVCSNEKCRVTTIQTIDVGLQFIKIISDLCFTIFRVEISEMG